jgi:hypothetical protein
MQMHEHTGKIRNAYENFTGKHEGKRPVGRPRRKREIIKMYI